MKQYDKALRWAELRDAASYHVNRQGIPLVIDIEYAKQFSVTDINVLEKIINPEINEANILVEISYYHKEYGTVKKIRQEQLWWLNQEAGVWLIESGFPEFK